MLWGCEKAPQVKQALKQFTDSTSSLGTKPFYTKPDSNLSAAWLNRAEHAKTQAEAATPAMTPEQAAAFAEADAQLRAAKLFVAAQTELDHALGADAVLVDSTYSPSAVQTTYATLQQTAPAYAKRIGDRVKLVVAEVAALQAVTVAKETPTAANVATADALVRAVPVAAFQAHYQPILAALTPAPVPETPDTTTPEASQPTDSAVATTSSDSPAAEAPAETPAGDATPSTAVAEAPDSTPATTADPDDAADAAAEAPAATMTINGPFATMAEAVAAMKTAQAATGQLATAYSLTQADGAVVYSWQFVTDDETDE